MGTDIHLAVEERRTGKAWRRVLPPDDFPRDEWTLKCYEEHKNDPPEADHGMADYYQRCYREEWYKDRNYDCFAILANVRNGTGFGGIQTGAGYKPIALPRGLPGDLSEELDQDDVFDKEGERKPGKFWLGDHSFSHLTLLELLRYDWNQVTSNAGVISFPAFFKREAEGITSPPDEYCGAIDGDGIITINEARARELAADYSGQGPITVRPGNKTIEPDKLYVQTWWPVTYRQAAGRFAEVVLPYLKTYADREHLRHDNLRIVFGFDS